MPDDRENGEREVSDESYPLGCGAGVQTERLAGYSAARVAATGRWDHTRPNPPAMLSRATTTITLDELEMMVMFHNKGVFEGLVCERYTNFLVSLIETSFAGQVLRQLDGQIIALPRGYFSETGK